MDKSLLQRTTQEQTDGEPRLMMLATIREYGLEQLRGSGEAEAVQRAHAGYYLAQAEEAEPNLIGPEQGTWLDRLERDHDNLRAALRWALARGEVELALRLGNALWQFWLMRGYLSEGRRWLDRALAISEPSAIPNGHDAHNTQYAVRNTPSRCAPRPCTLPESWPTARPTTVRPCRCGRKAWLCSVQWATRREWPLRSMAWGAGPTLRATRRQHRDCLRKA